MTFLYIRDFCKFLFESNATQTTKIHLIKYTVVIFLAPSLFICSFIYFAKLKCLLGLLYLIMILLLLNDIGIIECITL